MTKPEPHPTSIPANAVYAILESLAATLAASLRRTEDYPLHAAGLDFQGSLGRAREKAELSDAEDEAFRHLRERFFEIWKTYEPSR